MNQSQNQALSVISEVVEKVISLQSSATEALTTLKTTIDSQTKNTQDAVDMMIDQAQTIQLIKQNLTQQSEIIKEIAGYFHNGFKQEIKEHVSEEAKEHDHCGECQGNIVETISEIIEEHHQFAVVMDDHLKEVDLHLDSVKDSMDEHIADLKEEIIKFRSFGFWAKIIIGLITALGAIATVALTLHNATMHPVTPTPVISPAASAPTH